MIPLSAETGNALDVSNTDLMVALDETERPELLRELIAISRQTFGFFQRHMIAYPWLIEHLEALPRSARILDVGAGLSPVPVWLAHRGYRVICIDKAGRIYRPPARPDWNAWGFFEYGLVHPNLAAYNVSVADYGPTQHLDAIYAAGALAHMPARARDRALSRLPGWMLPGGVFLAIVDLVQGTELLWNGGPNNQVEPRERHGTITDILDRLTTAGFGIDEQRTVVRPNHFTDLFLVRCTR
jgi:hypothetical protein